MTREGLLHAPPPARAARSLFCPRWCVNASSRTSYSEIRATDFCTGSVVWDQAKKQVGEDFATCFSACEVLLLTLPKPVYYAVKAAGGPFVDCRLAIRSGLKLDVIVAGAVMAFPLHATLFFVEGLAVEPISWIVPNSSISPAHSCKPPMSISTAVK